MRAALVACLLLKLVNAAPSEDDPPPPPLALNMTLLQMARARVAAGDPSLVLPYETLVRWATEALSSGPWSVVDCPHTPPSGDKHDYISVSKYFWPCNANPCNASSPQCDASTGLPWLDCDGRTNFDAVNQYDLPRITNMSSTVQLLSHAYALSGNVSFASRAASLLRTWFLDPSTSMNPNGNFMQAVPGVNNGSSWGLIEISVALTDLLDCASLLSTSGEWTAADTSAMRSWLGRWAQWLRTDALPLAEAHANNNHQTYYDALALSTAVWTGDLDWAAQILNSTLEPPPAGNPFAPIGVQIWRDGELPAEELRTNSVGYFQMDTLGLLRLATMRRTLGAALDPLGVPDLATYISRANGSHIQGPVEFIIPYATGSEAWPWENIEHATFGVFFEVFRRAAHMDGWTTPSGQPAGDYYINIANSLPGNHSNDPLNLLWLWPPSPTP